MNDFDDVRTCCSDAKLCNKCWGFMIIAYKILNSILREDFGFTNLMWVFSGRRGIHCWVCDDKVRKLNNQGRTAVAKFIKMQIATTNGLNSLLRSPLHPSIERSLAIIAEDFDELVLRKQNVFNRKQIQDLVIQYLKAYLGKKYSEHAKKLEAILSGADNSESKWGALLTYLGNVRQREDKYTKDKIELCIKDIQIALTYPRLDENVSKHINHLLKAPFCIHPKTGLISVPLTEEDLFSFDLNNVPNIDESIDDHMNNREGKLSHHLQFFSYLVESFNK